ncbi:PKD domain protein [Porphyromonas macacae]|uniref:PKD domain n=1 Tax=Porphyromonas macacae TaxID=28115 RepID=A0A0A2ECC9_9PORP|nr:PKD domain-containing protein [Porphyromonas macacae]KGN75110.1 PKD domain protein [Porphyromonas macacae]SUB89321.1 PKD domain [Porphyromonas macacae]
MNKIFTRWMIIVLAALVVGVFVAWLLRQQFAVHEIRAFISPTEIELGDSIRFSDSTLHADEVLWEFGNGDMSIQKSGYYVFPQIGRYQVRLKVDNKQETRFIVNVKEPRRALEQKSIRIIAPETALQNEYISFMADGNSQEWRWEFGETGEIDSKEKNPTYSYQNPGIYEVHLSSEDTEYPVIHRIEILPEYAESESIDVLTLIATDIQEHLQNIVDGEPFNSNYNYILEKYLCNNPNAQVLVNNVKQNDFYSYCHELKIIGSRSSTVIVEVVVEPDKKSNCVKKLLIRQSSLTQEKTL